MCDTFVALPNATCDGSVIFGKNSDREPNEAHQLCLIPHAWHQPGDMVECTYRQIPQVEETNAVLLSKPFWIWGAEMGANEHGVVIGNEAVFTKVPYDKGPGLIGMDFLRLALERGATADEAMNVIIDLLANYGQGGNCGYDHKLFYHNSFLIADPKSAWILETAGQFWAAQRVQDVASISNVITIGSSWDRVSEGLVAHAVEKGWCKNETDFDFSRCYSDLIYTTFAAGKHRLCRTRTLLQENVGQIDVPFAMQLLRDHGPDAGEDWTPAKGLFGAEVCMHASFGPVRGSQSTGSMISHLKDDVQTHWLTGTAAPCTSIFKPVWMDSGLPESGLSPSDQYDHAMLWWRHEDLHREILRDYSTRIAVLEKERDLFEAEWVQSALKVGDASADERRQLTLDAFEKSDQLSSKWLEKVKALPRQHSRPILHRMAWEKFDRSAGRLPA